MSDECRNSFAKFGGAARRGCYDIWRNSRGGGTNIRPPSVRGLKTYGLNCVQGAILNFDAGSEVMFRILPDLET